MLDELSQANATNPAEAIQRVLSRHGHTLGAAERQILEQSLNHLRRQGYGASIHRWFAQVLDDTLGDSTRVTQGESVLRRLGLFVEWQSMTQAQSAALLRAHRATSIASKYRLLRQDNLFTHTQARALMENFVAGVRPSNPFHITSSVLSVPQRQALALSVLSQASDDLVSQELRQLIRQKQQANAFRHAPTEGAVVRSLNELPTEEQVQHALRYVLETFRSAEFGDSALRNAVIRQLGGSPANALSTIEGLLPLTRGIGTISGEEARLANEAIRAITQRHSSALPAIIPDRRGLTLLGNRSAEIAEVLNSPIANVRRLGSGSGVNGTFIIEFANGRRAVVKPFAAESTHGSGNLNQVLFSREADASRLFENFFSQARTFRVGNQNVHISVPPNVEVTLNLTLPTGERLMGAASLQLFQEGFSPVSQVFNPAGPASRVSDVNQYLSVWRRFDEHPAAESISSWLRSYDYIIGNHDRLPNAIHRFGNPNNLMWHAADDGSIHIAVIDNALGRGMRNDFSLTGLHRPNLRHLPQPMRESILNFRAEEYRRLFSDTMPDEAIEDVIRRIQELQRFIASEAH